MTIEFQKFPSISRLHREMVVTEKIDGSNAAIVIGEDGEFGVQSRSRVITPEDDNFGFARWAYFHKDALVDALGVGYHFGEWWGARIQRGYGLKNGDKRFSLFNTPRWRDTDFSKYDVPGLGIVPEIYVGEFCTSYIEYLMEDVLREHGSYAVEGYSKPEGLVIYNTASRVAYKTTYDECDSYDHNGGKTWSAS